MGYLDNRGLFDTYGPPKGSYGKVRRELKRNLLGGPKKESTIVDDTIEYLKSQRHYNCPPPGELTDILYQKWLEIGSVEELEGFYIKPETMLRLREYEKHNQLVLEQIQIEKQLEEEAKKLTDELIQDDIKNQEMFLELLYNNQTKLDSEWVELRNYYENT
jgi:hypothetical protein